MKSKKVTIGCLYNVLLGLISEEGTYLSEIRCVCNRAGKYFLLCALGARFIRDQKVEKCLGLAIAKFDDRVCWLGVSVDIIHWLMGFTDEDTK
jgi:hypothetical protein